MNPKSCLICVGSELLRGKLNTHASTLARRLASIGLSLNAEETVGDDLSELTPAIRRALQSYEIVFVTGGLGPTFDDLTREAASQATGRSLHLDSRLLKDIRRKFRKANYRMPPANARQANVLVGASVIPNQVGTAPGQWLKLSLRASDLPAGRQEAKRGNLRRPPSEIATSPAAPRDDSVQKILVLLPGPPRELQPMLDKWVIPRLRKTFPALPHAEAHLHFVGVPESVVDHKIRPIISKLGSGPNLKGGGDWGLTPKTIVVDFTILAHLGLVDLDIFVSARIPSKARRTLEQIVCAVQKVIGKSFYGRDQNYSLEKVVSDHFRRRHWTLAVAESCTGGMLASRLTDIAGSSNFFLGGWVTYANRLKQNELSIPAAMLKKSGAVSRPVALAMAQGARRRAGSTWGLGITGIAGPGGGSRQKPVGLVYMALASAGKSFCRESRFTGDREAIRQRTVLAALDLLRSL